MKDLYKKSEKFLTLIDNFEGKYITFEGQMLHTQEAFSALDKIIKQGLKLYNDIVEAKLYEKYPALNIIMHHIKEYTDKLEINDNNAKKLTLENSLVIWQQLEVALAALASYTMDYLHEEGN